MDHLRPEDTARDLQRGAREGGEADVIVGIITEGVSVQAVSIVELGALEEIVWNSVAGLVDAGRIPHTGQPDGQIVIDAAGAVKLHTPVARQQD